MTENISYDDFLKVDLRVGKITRVEPFPKARKPAFKLWIDFGQELGTKQSSAQITARYNEQELQGRLIVAVVNFAPRQVADFKSEVLVLGSLSENNEVILLTPEPGSCPGARVF